MQISMVNVEERIWDKCKTKGTVFSGYRGLYEDMIWTEFNVNHADVAVRELLEELIFSSKAEQDTFRHTVFGSLGTLLRDMVCACVWG